MLSAFSTWRSCGALVHNLKGHTRMNKTLTAHFKQLRRQLNRLSAHVVRSNPHLDASTRASRASKPAADAHTKLPENRKDLPR